MEAALAVASPTWTPEYLPSDEDVKQMLDALVENRDLEALHGAVAKADALRDLYARHKDSEQQMEHYAWVSIQAAAAFGLVDMELHPTISVEMKDQPLIVGGGVLGTAQRSRWRRLGVAYRRGYLRTGFESGTGKGTRNTDDRLRRRGVFHVPVESFAEAVEKSGASLSEVSRRAGKDPAALSALLRKFRREDQEVVSWSKAAPYLEAAGIDPTDTSLVPCGVPPKRRRGGKNGKARVESVAKPKDQRLDRSALLIRRLLVELHRVVGEDQQNKWGLASTVQTLYRCEDEILRARPVLR
jgi:hypothetical protein